MGKLEYLSKKRSQKKDVRRLILFAVAAAGLLSIALVAPNVLGAMKKLGLFPHQQQRSVIRRARDRLIQQGLVRSVDGRLQLTGSGKHEIERLERAEYKIARPRRWDKKWRILAFDIPEYRKPLREKIRRTLASIGFVRLQDSVWLYPYDCEDLLVLLKADFKIGKDLLYIIADSVESDRRYLKHFELGF